MVVSKYAYDYTFFILEIIDRTFKVFSIFISILASTF